VINIVIVYIVVIIIIVEMMVVVVIIISRRMKNSICVVLHTINVINASLWNSLKYCFNLRLMMKRRKKEEIGIFNEI
jgi:hypothetical protein